MLLAIGLGIVELVVLPFGGVGLGAGLLLGLLVVLAAIGGAGVLRAQTAGEGKAKAAAAALARQVILKSALGEGVQDESASPAEPAEPDDSVTRFITTGSDGASVCGSDGIEPIRLTTSRPEDDLPEHRVVRREAGGDGGVLGRDDEELRARGARRLGLGLGHRHDAAGVCCEGGGGSTTV